MQNNPNDSYESNTRDDKIRAIIVAYACEPNKVSEPGVGWNIVLEVAAFADITVITRENNREAIEKALENETYIHLRCVNWVYIDLPIFFKRLKKSIPLGVQAYYALWQWKALLACKRLIYIDEYDLLHHLTFGVTWLSPVVSLLKIPFVWGPIAGGDLVPSCIMSRERFIPRLQERAYRLLSRVVMKISPFNWLARRRASAIIFRARSMEKVYPKTPGVIREVMCETATRERVRHTNAPPVPFRALSVGRLQYWKGFRYSVEGFARFLQAGGVGELVILGDGPERKVIERIHKELGGLESIKIMGKVAHDEVIKYLDCANVLIHPSFRDGGSWAVMEALIHGVPVIGINSSGVADMVDANSGLLVEPSNPDSVSNDIAKSLLTLSCDEARWKALSKGANMRIESAYLWEHRKETLRDIYQRVSGNYRANA